MGNTDIDTLFQPTHISLGDTGRMVHGNSTPIETAALNTALVSLAAGNIGPCRVCRGLVLKIVQDYTPTGRSSVLAGGNVVLKNVWSGSGPVISRPRSASRTR